MYSEDDELEEIKIRDCNYLVEPRLLEAAKDVFKFKQIFDENKDYQISEKLFTTIIRNLKHELYGHAYKETFYLLLEIIPTTEIVRYVNARDENKKIPLEYVGGFQGANSEFDDVVRILLDKGASLAEKNSYGKPVIHSLKYMKVKDYLDGCVIKENGNVRYDFKNILPWQYQLETEYVNVLEFPIFINSSNQYKQLMTHELLAMFLVHVCRVKWLSHRGIFYANFCLFFIFYSSICLQVASFYYSGINAWAFLLVSTCLIATREIFQFIIAPKLYLHTTENYLEIVIITLTITASFLENNSNIEEFVIFAFLFATFDLLLQVGKHRLLIRYIQLFKIVLKIFVKLLFFIIIIIIAFAVSFNVLFNSQSPFETVPISTFKTIVMLTGEYDSGNLNYGHHPISSHLLLLFFVIIISIVLMNVILGLAVSDIQKLERNSRLHGFISNVEFFHQVETLLFKTKVKVIFQYLGKIHKSLNFPRKIIQANRNLWWSLNISPASSRLMSQIVDDEDMAQIKLNQKVNRICDEISSLRDDIRNDMNLLQSQLTCKCNKINDCFDSDIININ